MFASFADPIGSYLGAWATDLTAPSILLRLSLAAVLAAVIGCERSNKRHSAGLRTFILVSLASASAMLVDLYLTRMTRLEIPVLSAAAIVGEAMLSGNSVLFNARNQIRGLTTSAGLWACGILGLAAGAGFYTLTLTAFLFLMCILTYLPAVEVWLTNRSNHFEIHLELKNKCNLQDFVTTIRRLGMTIDDIESNSAYIGSGLSVYTIMISVSSQKLKKYKSHSEIIQALATLDYIYHIEELR